MREADLHTVVVQWLKWHLPASAIFHHSPNEGKRGWRSQAALKSHGTQAGWPDLEILYAGTAYFIELKAPKKYLTPAQKAMHERLRAAGFVVLTCRSLAEVETTLDLWGLPLRVRTAVA